MAARSNPPQERSAQGWRGRAGTLYAEDALEIPVGDAVLSGDLALPERARGVVLFAHGSGSSRHSPRNRRVAEGLYAAGLGTLLVDLLTEEEEQIDVQTRRLRFDIDLLAGRLAALVDWLHGDARTHALGIGLFGASTGGGAALVAAAQRPQVVRAVVSRGGRPDLAGEALPRVRAPTLLIVGALDVTVIELNRAAAAQLRDAEVEIEIVEGASHLFEEPGKLERVTELAATWFTRHLGAAA